MRIPSSLVWMAAAVAALALGINGASAGGGVTLETGCTPEAVRPLEFSLFTCHATVTNTGDQAIESVRIQLLPPTQLRIAFPSHFDQRLDGELLPNQPHGPNVLLGTIGPGQSRTLTIRFIAAPEIEGEYGLEFQVQGAGNVTGDRTARFSAGPDATAPPTDLEMQLARMDELTPLLPPLDYLAAPLPEATYGLMIVNRSEEAITELSAAMRFQSDAAPVELEPSPTSIDRALGLATWDLSDFGMPSLGQGEELHVRAVFTSGTPNACTYVQPLAIAETPVGKFAAPPSFGAPIGTCETIDNEGRACFFFGVGLPYPVSCEQNEGECFPPDAPGFPVPENGIVCITVFSPTPGPTEPTPTPTPSPPVAGLPDTGTGGSNTSPPWAVAASLAAAALAMAAIGLSLRKNRL